MTMTNTQMLAYSSHDLEAWTNGRYGRRGSTVPGNQWSMAAGIMSLGDLVSKPCSQSQTINTCNCLAQIETGESALSTMSDIRAFGKLGDD
jgi:hypothetical protein